MKIMNEEQVILMNYFIEQAGVEAPITTLQETITTPIINGEITTTEQIDALL